MLELPACDRDTTKAVILESHAQPHNLSPIPDYGQAVTGAGAGPPLKRGWTTPDAP